MDGPHPPRPDMPVGKVAEVEHLARPVLALEHHAGPIGVDRDHLGGLSVELIGAIVVAGELDAVAGAELLRDVSGEIKTIRDAGGTALVTFDYDDLGRRAGLTRANGTSAAYGYDAASRLTSLRLTGGNQPNTLGFDYNPAQQITSRSSSNDAYAWTGAYNVDRSYGVNGLNQLTSAGSTSLGYDLRGNLTTSGTTTYSYTADNLLATAPGANLAYDPLGRLFNINAENGTNTTLTYDGADVMTEVNQSDGTLLRRYVYGPGSDEPLIWYEGSGLGDRRWLHADERGSVVEVTNDAGNAIAVNTYDEFGIPGAGNVGRFQYTGQKWLPSLGLYDYKARIYSPTLGRFLQTDPIGYGDGLNWYNYVGGDPVNKIDPTGQKLLPATPVCTQTNTMPNPSDRNVCIWTMGNTPANTQIWPFSTATASGPSLDIISATMDCRKMMGVRTSSSPLGFLRVLLQNRTILFGASRGNW